MNLSIIGSGVVGQAFGHALVANGHDVLFMDIAPKALPNNDHFTLDFDMAFRHADALVVCVPTELGKDGECELAAFEIVARQFAAQVSTTRRRVTLIQKSTCPPGTAENTIRLIEGEYGLQNGIDFGYVVFPSFLNMGHPLEDELLQRKCLIGLRCGDDDRAWEHTMMEQMLSWTQPLFHSYATIEFAKYANNVMHAGILSIWNELFLLGREWAVDTDWVAKVTAQEPGLESVYRVHGMAWGGACLPKDTRALLSLGRQLGLEMNLLSAMIDVNDRMARTFGIRTTHWRELHH